MYSMHLILTREKSKVMNKLQRYRAILVQIDWLHHFLCFALSFRGVSFLAAMAPTFALCYRTTDLLIHFRMYTRHIDRLIQPPSCFIPNVYCKSTRSTPMLSVLPRT